MEGMHFHSFSCKVHEFHLHLPPWNLSRLVTLNDVQQAESAEMKQLGLEGASFSKREKQN
jgi:hypothetical protein